jgi:hypothetical protein
MTPNQLVASLFDHAEMAQDRAATDFGAVLHRGKVFVHWPTLYAFHWRTAPPEWNLRRDATWRDLSRLLQPFLPAPVLGPDDPHVQTYAGVLARAASEFSAFEMHRAPLLASAGLLRTPESIARYENHWVRQALWAFLDADERAAADVGVFVHPDHASVIIHWPTRAALYPFDRLPSIPQQDPDYEAKMQARRITARAPQQLHSQSCTEVKRLFDRHPLVRRATLPNRAAKVRAYAAYAVSPWFAARAQCSILDATRFAEALKALPVVEPRRQRRLRFADVFLSSFLQEDNDLSAHASVMEALELSSGGAVRVHIRPVRGGWYLALAGCFDGNLGATTALQSDVAAFHKLAAKAATANPPVKIDDTCFDIVDDRVFLNAEGLLTVLKFQLPRKEPVLGLVAYYNKLLTGMPLPKFRVEIKPLEQRRYPKNGRYYATRGAAWTHAEDDVLHNWFAPDPHGVRHRLGEREWSSILGQLPGRTRDAIRVRLTTLNHNIIGQLKGEKGPAWRKFWPSRRLGQPRGPAPIPEGSLPAKAKHIVHEGAVN